jgi:hypothetical protein
MLLPGRFWNGIFTKGIFTPVEIASKTQTLAVQDVKKEDANLRTLPPSWKIMTTYNRNLSSFGLLDGGTDFRTSIFTSSHLKIYIL